MRAHPHTTDKTGFDFMSNSGQEELDRDTVGIVFALGLLGLLTLCQYLGLY